MGGLWQDVKYGVRTLGKNPGFTATAVITLALAIGANTAVFSVVDPLLLRKLPVERPEELVLVGAGGSLESNTTSEASTYQIYRDQNQVFAGTFASSDAGAQEVIRNGTSYSADGELVTGSYFPILGVRPLQGRLIAPADDVAPVGSPIVVLSFDFWQRAFSGSPSVIGQSLTIYGVPFTVVGVTPPEFFGTTVGRSPDFFMPMSAAMGTRRARIAGLASWLTIFGRLKRGETLEQASAGIQPLFSEAVRESSLPEVEKGQDMARLVLTPAARGLDELRQQFSLSGRILFAAAGFILLIACANVTNLMLTRSLERRKELMVRLALGAGRARVLRQLLSESALLTIGGGALGLLFAWWTSHALVAALSTKRAPFLLKAGLDLRVLGFATAAAIVTTLVTGLAPAFLATGRELSEELKVHASRTAAMRGTRWTRGMMVAQLAAGVTILAVTGLLVHSLVNLETMDVGFSRAHVLGVSFDASAARRSEGQNANFYADLMNKTKALPGVRSVALSLLVPMQDQMYGINVSVEGETAQREKKGHVLFTSVSPGYFETMGIPLLAGRDFTDHDPIGLNTGSVAIISLTMARHYFGEENPIGKRLRTVEGNRRSIEIIGLVQDAKYNGLREETPDYLYVPMQNARTNLWGKLMIRTDQEASALSGPVREIIERLDASVAIGDVETMQQEIDESLHQDRLVAALSGGFSLLALALTAVGLFGVLSFSVARRTSEIGVRMALGARPADIFRLIVGNGMMLVVMGMAIGAGGAAAAGRLLRGMLFGVKGFDPVAMGSVVLVLGAAAFLACYLPARRASRVDPMRALRSE